MVFNGHGGVSGGAGEYSIVQNIALTATSTESTENLTSPAKILLVSGVYAQSNNPYAFFGGAMAGGGQKNAGPIAFSLSADGKTITVRNQTSNPATVQVKCVALG